MVYVLNFCLHFSLKFLVYLPFFLCFLHLSQSCGCYCSFFQTAVYNYFVLCSVCLLLSSTTINLSNIAFHFHFHTHLHFCLSILQHFLLCRHSPGAHILHHSSICPQYLLNFRSLVGFLWPKKESQRIHSNANKQIPTTQQTHTNTQNKNAAADRQQTRTQSHSDESHKYTARTHTQTLKWPTDGLSVCPLDTLANLVWMSVQANGWMIGLKDEWLVEVEWAGGQTDGWLPAGQ